MKKFYFYRMHDVGGVSGCGVVAEGILFDVGGGAFTWLTEHRTVTVFDKITTIKKIHSHGDFTKVVIEGSRGDKGLFEKCQELAKKKKDELKKLRKPL